MLDVQFGKEEVVQLSSSARKVPEICVASFKGKIKNKKLKTSLY